MVCWNGNFAKVLKSNWGQGAPLPPINLQLSLTGKLFFLSGTLITERIKHWIRCICICWQHAAPNTYIKNLTSHLQAMIRTHNFDFSIRYWPISAQTSNKTDHGKKQCLVLSVVSVHDLKYQLYGFRFVSCCGNAFLSHLRCLLFKPIERVWFATFATITSNVISYL